MDDELNHRFYEPDAITFSPGLVRDLHTEGSNLARRLGAGDASLMPDAVEGWLTLHSLAVNGRAPGIMRGRVAAEINQPPYDCDKALRVGSLIRDTIAVTHDFGVLMGETQRRIAEAMGDTNNDE